MVPYYVEAAKLYVYCTWEGRFPDRQCDTTSLEVKTVHCEPSSFYLGGRRHSTSTSGDSLPSLAWRFTFVTQQPALISSHFSLQVPSLRYNQAIPLPSEAQLPSASEPSSPAGPPPAQPAARAGGQPEGGPFKLSLAAAAGSTGSKSCAALPRAPPKTPV